MLRDDGGPNRFFLMYLFCEQSIAIQFLLRGRMQCNTCDRAMTCAQIPVFLKDFFGDVKGGFLGSAYITNQL